MTELVTWFNDERTAGRLHPLLLIGIWVVVFLAIHPFQDGNGRLSRVLTTLLLLQAGYAYVPYSSLESVIEQGKEAYYLALRQTQGTIRSEAPNWQPWLVFFLRALAEQKQRLNRKVERERIVLAPLPDLSLKVVEFAREHGRVTMANAIRITGSNRNTLKQHFRALVEQGHLVQRGAGRGVWYEDALRVRARIAAAWRLLRRGIEFFDFVFECAQLRDDVGRARRRAEGHVGHGPVVGLQRLQGVLAREQAQGARYCQVVARSVAGIEALLRRV